MTQSGAMVNPGFRSQPDRIDEVEQLRATVETQARVIRYLLSNYDALLKKVEREDGHGGGGGP